MYGRLARRMYRCARAVTSAAVNQPQSGMRGPSLSSTRYISSPMPEWQTPELRDVVNSVKPFANPTSSLSNGFAKIAAVSYPWSRNCSASRGPSYSNPRSSHVVLHQFAPVSTAKWEGIVHDAGAYALLKFVAPAANRAR